LELFLGGGIVEFLSSNKDYINNVLDVEMLVVGVGGEVV
jgi:hypothetical protein